MTDSNWLNIETDARDEAWEKGFLADLAKIDVHVVDSQPQLGPDRWPYLSVATSKDAAGSALEPMPAVLAWLSTRGIGLVLNASKSVPDFVLTYGMIWNFRERGEFLTEVERLPAGPIEIPPQTEVLTGTPSEKYLPPYVRLILRQFLGDQGALQPKVLMVSFDQKNYDLCFSIESLNSPPASEHAGIAEALSWFLPAHYSVALVSEKSIAGFLPL